VGYPYTIRALTLHVSRRTLENESLLEEKMTRLLEARDAVESALDIRVDSLRVTMPNLESEPLLDAMDVVMSIKPEEVIASIGNIASSNSKLEELVRRAVYNDLYVGILLEEATWEHARRLSKLIHELVEEDLGYATRVGVNTLGSPIYTPYYPLSYSPGDLDSLTASLTYPNYLRDAFQKGGLNGLREAVLEAGLVALRVLEEASKVVEVKMGGIDLSVAPWMEESSLGLAEAVAGVRLPKPGFAMGVRLVNEALEAARGRAPLVGFNELQLPVAEDSRLKARVSEGEVKARDLARLSGVCLAGLDLVVVPASVEEVAGLILEVSAYARSKGKPLGVRLVPVDGVEPGEVVRLPRFGETPVIPI